MVQLVSHSALCGSWAVVPGGATGPDVSGEDEDDDEEEKWEERMLTEDGLVYATAAAEVRSSSFPILWMGR